MNSLLISEQLMRDVPHLLSTRCVFIDFPKSKIGIVHLYGSQKTVSAWKMTWKMIADDVAVDVDAAIENCEMLHNPESTHSANDLY